MDSSLLWYICSELVAVVRCDIKENICKYLYHNIFAVKSDKKLRIII